MVAKIFPPKAEKVVESFCFGDDDSLVFSKRCQQIPEVKLIARFIKNISSVTPVAQYQ